METKKIKRNYIFNTLYQMLLLLAPFLTMPYVSRKLGTNGMGLFSYVESVSAYFVLFATLGINTYGQREISYIQDSRDKITRFFWNTKCFQIILSSIVFVIYVCFALKQNNTIIYLLFSLNIIGSALDVSWLYQGLEEFAIIVKVNTIAKILTIIFVLTCIKTEKDLWIYVLCLASAYVLGNLYMWRYLKKYINRPDIKSLNIWNNCGQIFLLFIPTIAVQLSLYLDKTMIGIITGSTIENGYYEQATKICRMVMTLVTSLSTVLIPRIGSCYVKKETDMVNRLMLMGYRFVFMLGVPLCIGLITVAPDFVPWFFGPGYEKSVPLIQILSFLILAIGINNMTGMQYLVPTGKQNIYTITVIAGAVINILLNCVLIPEYLSIGAAIASVMAESCIALFQLIAVRHELPVISIFKNSYKYLLSGLIMYVFLKIEKNIFLYNKSAVMSILLMTATGAVVYFVMLTIMKDEFFMENVKQFVRKRK